MEKLSSKEKLEMIRKRFEEMTQEEYNEMLEDFKDWNPDLYSTPQNYKIIQDEDKLKEFIEWLPDLKPNEQYYLALFFRKKYCPIIKLDKGQLKRVTATKDFIFRKIKQMECEVGSYTHNDIILPQDGLALYITPNPRDLELATKKSLILFADKITKPYSGYNPQSEVMSIIQDSCSRKIFIDFDFDGIDFETVKMKISEYLNPSCCTVVKTRGGFHLLVNTSKVVDSFRKSWYMNISSIEGCDVRGDNLLPVVGCAQGGFVPHFIHKN